MNTNKNADKIKKEKKQIIKKWWFWLLVLFILIIIFSPSSENTQNNNDSTEVKNSTSETSSENSKNSQSESPKSKLLSSILNLTQNKKAFDTGSYAVGEIPTGEYAFVSISSGSSYYSEKDASGNIIDNENFDSWGWIYVNGVGNIDTRGILVKESDFSSLGVSSAKEIYLILNELDNTYNQSGYYKVGVDINEGTHNLTSIGGQGYVSIESGPLGNSDIIDNEIFNGNYSINITNGQYIKVSKSSIQ